MGSKVIQRKFVRTSCLYKLKLESCVVCRLKLLQGGNVWDHRGARDLHTLSEFVTSHTGETEHKRVEPTALTDSTFTEFITSKAGIHFAKFYAPW